MEQPISVGIDVSKATLDLAIVPLGLCEQVPNTRDGWDRIVQLLGDVPRLELFARQAAAGWDAWGNQAPERPADDFPEIEPTTNRKYPSNMAPMVREAPDVNAAARAARRPRKRSVRAGNTPLPAGADHTSSIGATALRLSTSRAAAPVSHQAREHYNEKRAKA